MKTHTVNTYSLAELKPLFPDAYRRAFDRYQSESARWDLPWQDEICDSLKAVFDRAGIRLSDWSLGAYSRNNYVRFDLGDAADLSGKRAFAWLEHNLFAGLRKSYSPPVQRYASEKKHGRRKPYTLAGETPACPLTGYCADEEFLGSLRADIRAGCTLRDAFGNLADVAGRLLENEADYQQSEEAFEAWADGQQFTEDGEEF